MLREDEKKLYFLYNAKIATGTSLGILLGIMHINPLTIWDKILYILLIVSCLAIIILSFHLSYKPKNTPLIKIALLHGTLWYFVLVIGFWTLFFNI